MLAIKFGEPINVNYVRTGVSTKTGEPWTLVCISENQNSESKSKSSIKCWGGSLPEGMKDGCKAKLVGMSEIRIVHEVIGEKYGKKQFRDSFEISGAAFELV